MKHGIVCCVGAAVLAPAWVSGDVVTIGPSKDNTMYADSGTWSNALGPGLYVGSNTAGWSRRALLAFDVVGAVPAGSTITEVTLTLRSTRAHGSTNPIRMHRLTANWGEGTSFAPDPAGSGTTATVGDATWSHRFWDAAPPGGSGGTLWAVEGGDFVQPVSSTVNVSGTGAYVWPSTATLVADVQGMLDNPASNFGWVLIANEALLSSAKRFASREYTTNTAYRPRLTVTFTPPCYANCDQSTATPTLNVADFTCFLQKFAAGATYANCDQSTALPTLNVADFTCFLQKFASGC